MSGSDRPDGPEAGTPAPEPEPAADGPSRPNPRKEPAPETGSAGPSRKMEPEAEVEAGSDVDPEPDVESDADTETGVRIEIQIEGEAESENEPQIDPEPEPEVESEIEAEHEAPSADPRHGPWWARRTARYADEPWSHLARAMSYEVMVVLVTAAAVAVLAFVVLQGRFQDFYVKLRPSAPVSGEVALLTIGPEALYLWNPEDPHPSVTPRPLIAELVRFLDAADADVIVLDLLLDTPAQGDVQLAEAANAHGAVVGAERLEVTEPASGRQFVAGLSPTLMDDLHSGFANFQAEQNTLFSGDLLVRRVPLVRLANRSHLAGTWPGNLVGGRQDIDQVVASLSLVAAALHRMGPTSRDELSRLLQAGCAGRPLQCTIGAADLGLPDVPGPLTEPLPINFRGPEHADGIPTVAAARALRVNAQAALMRDLGVEADIEVPEDLRALLAGRVVVVGRVDAGANDRFVTPYSLPVPIEPDMAGPRIHAQVIDTLLSGHHVRSVGGGLAWLVGLVLAGAVLVSWRVLRDDVLALLWIGTAVVLVVLGVVVFHRTDGLSLDLGPPLIGILTPLFFLTLRGWAVEDSQRT